MTYQHGLPFNQRVERKDKVKSRSLTPLTIYSKGTRVRRRHMGAIMQSAAIRELDQMGVDPGKRFYEDA